MVLLPLLFALSSPPAAGVKVVLSCNEKSIVSAPVVICKTNDSSAQTAKVVASAAATEKTIPKVV